LVPTGDSPRARAFLHELLILKDAVDLRVQAIDDGARRTGWSEHAEPYVDLESRKRARLRDSRNIGQDGVRTSSAMAIARSLPDLKCGTSELIEAMEKVTSLEKQCGTRKGRALVGHRRTVGTPHHLGAELLKSMTGIDIVHVPYKGAAFLVRHCFQARSLSPLPRSARLVPHFKVGQAARDRHCRRRTHAILPDVPTIAEAGPLPGFKIDVWFGVLAPAGTPRPIVDRLNTEINRILQDQQLVKEKPRPRGCRRSAPRRAHWKS